MSYKPTWPSQPNFTDPHQIAGWVESGRRSFRRFVQLFFPYLNPGRTLIPDMATDATAEHLQAVRDGQITQLLILEPPGTLKSFTAMVCFPAWVWIDNPRCQFVAASGSQANRHRDSIACRDLIRSELYWRNYVQKGESAPLWRLKDDQDTKEKFENTLRGWRDSATSGETVTGRKGDINLGDDLMDASKVISAAYRRNIVHWFDTAFWNRVNDEREARRVVVGQHVDPDDLQSHLIRRGGWEVLRLEEIRSHRPARTFLWVDRRQPGEFLRPRRHGPNEMRAAIRQMGAAGYETQHNQNPSRSAGKMFPREKANRIQLMPIPLTAMRYWDIASSKTETACASASVLGGFTLQKRFVVVHATRGNWMPDERNRQIRNECTGDLYRPGLEYRGTMFERQPAAAGVDFSEGLIKFCAGLPVQPSPAVQTDKFNRAIPLSTYWSEGLVDIVAGEWNEWFLDYMEAFERGAAPNRLDVGDAASGCFSRMSEGPVDVDPYAGDPTNPNDDADPYAGTLSGEEVMNARW